jgi:hypothetical protein
MANPSEDPGLRSAKREALVVLVIALGSLTYTVCTCYVLGYGRAGEPIAFVLGFPAWVFWGIVLPWGICVVLSAWFSLVFMTDESWAATSEDDPDGAPIDRDDTHA